MIKDKTYNSGEREKYELTQVYKSYADYTFPNNENRHPCYKNAAVYVLCLPTNDEYHFPNWKCVLRKCNDCTSISLPGVEKYSYNQAQMIMFNTYMTQFTCSHHGILIHKKIATYLYAKEHLKGLVPYVNN